MKWIGLTGGIATGKSTASRLIESLGVPVIDADKISHDLSDIGASGYTKIVSHFGTNILNSDQSIDRKKLGDLIFSNTQMKTDLEQILHPLIQEKVQEQKKHYQYSGNSLCFYDVPLLFEKNLEQNFDHTVLIWCHHKTQMSRLMERNRLTIDEAVKRIQNQTPLIQKVSRADFCVDNSGVKEDLFKQLKYLIKVLS